MPLGVEQARVEAAAKILADLRRTGQKITDLPAECQARNFWEAYAIQDAVVKELGETVGGWKAAARSLHARTNFSPIFARDIRETPARFEAPGRGLCGVECELFFRFERDLPERGRLYERSEILESVSLYPGIEILDSRFLDIRKIKRFSAVADNDTNSGLVYGPRAENWHGMNLARPRVDVTRNGKLFIMGNGIHGEDPLRNVTELVNHLCARQGGVAKGIFVTTGTCTSIVFVEPGDTIVADYWRIGRIEVSFPL